MNSERIKLNNSNIENIRKQIMKKNNGNPYFATEKESKSVITDFDSFPYNRWWRGIAGSCNPVVIEREAGWRIRNDNCYKNYKLNYENENIHDCKLIKKYVKDEDEDEDTSQNNNNNNNNNNNTMCDKQL